MDPYATAQAYTLAHKNLKADWYYTEPRFSANRILLDQAADTRARLARLAPASLETLIERHSFWINVYNGAVIEQAIDMGAKTSIKEVRGFFRRRFLEVAGNSLSLDDIEHGLLRDNRRHPARLLPNLLFRPHIKKWIASPFDPRIHFALNCGAQSCPPIAVYTPVEIDAQLDQAVAAFLDGETTIDTATQTISANPILRWYRADFGDLEGWIRRHRSDGLPAGRWHFKWNPYDWSV